ncbi:MAG: hypothetical protein WBL91_21755, partial [Pseudolabrys sp.]
VGISLSGKAQAKLMNWLVTNQADQMLLSLEQKQNIADRLAEILQESERTVLDQIEYTRDALLSELEEARQLALKRGQPSAAVQASMGKARILGLIIDRREVGDPGAFDDKTDEELMEEAKRRAAALGLLPPETQH